MHGSRDDYPDVHVHIIPRRAKDFEPLDESEFKACRLFSRHEPFLTLTCPVYNALDAKNLSKDFAEAYASRPSRSERKAYEAELRERERGNVESPFSGIEGERNPRDKEEMRREAERLTGQFPEENRAIFSETEEGQDQ